MVKVLKFISDVLIDVAAHILCLGNHVGLEAEKRCPGHEYEHIQGEFLEQCKICGKITFTE